MGKGAQRGRMGWYLPPLHKTTETQATIGKASRIILMGLPRPSTCPLASTHYVYVLHARKLKVLCMKSQSVRKSQGYHT